MIEIGSVLEGKYEILSQIGHGGMSRVYLAMDKKLNKQWAVKEVDKEGKDENKEFVISSMRVEADIMKRLDHPSLPRIVDIIDDEKSIIVIMDYVEGLSLDKELARSGPQNEENVINWARQLCDVLYYLHSQKPPIIYRDMKPANVMLKPDGNIKVIDFGIAREYKEENIKDTTVLGTRGYAPPEQYSRQTDARSDIYALGMTMFSLLTGEVPKPGFELIYRPVRTINPALSEGIEIIIDKCVAPAAENRYQNCMDLLFDLEHPDLITKGYKQRQKKKLTVFACAAGLSMLMLFMGLIFSITSTKIKKNNYDALISLSTATGVDEKIESYKKAIDVYPADTRAYSKIIEAYTDNGKFSQNESSELLALYNRNKGLFDKQSSDTAQLNYEIGMLFFNNYTNSDSTASFSERVQKAYPFFLENHDNAKEMNESFQFQNVSECYYKICKFYKDYIFDSFNAREPGKQEYTEVIDSINKTIDDFAESSAHDKLIFCNGAFMFLHDQRINMASVNVDKTEILQLLAKIKNKASDQNVNKERSVKLKNEILDNYDAYRMDIERAYDNDEIRGQE